MTQVEAAPKRPRTKPAETRREELMNAAQALFLSKTFDATSVDEIVKNADVAKGTFYLYFKTKDDVLLALQERFIRQFRERLESAVADHPGDDWTGKLNSWIEAAINIYLEQFALHDMVFHQFRPTHDHSRNRNPVTEHLASLIADGQTSSAWETRCPTLMATMLFGALHAAVDDEILAPTKMGSKRLVADLRALFHAALSIPEN